MKTLTEENLASEMEVLIQDLKQKGIHLVLFRGDLGRGKTTSIQTLARLLGVKEPVLSPTFVLMKSYETTDDVFKTLLHIDAYRITDGTLFTLLKLETYLKKVDVLMCVEWAEYIPELGHYPHALVHLEYVDETTRAFDVSFVS